VSGYRGTLLAEHEVPWQESDNTHRSEDPVSLGERTSNSKRNKLGKPAKWHFLTQYDGYMRPADLDQDVVRSRDAYSWGSEPEERLESECYIQVLVVAKADGSGAHRTPLFVRHRRRCGMSDDGNMDASRDAS